MQGGKRVGTKWQLKVVKADGSVEEYLHTKVLGAISNALGRAGQADIYVAEQLADVVTYFLYHKQKRRTVASSEIFSVIGVVLTATGYQDTAAAMNEHHFERKLKRDRLEVVSFNAQRPTDAGMFCDAAESAGRNRWNKSIIVKDLVTGYGIDRQSARAVASMVEEKIFNIGMTSVPTGLIKQLVISDTAAVLHARQQLQTV